MQCFASQSFVWHVIDKDLCYLVNPIGAVVIALSRVKRQACNNLWQYVKVSVEICWVCLGAMFAFKQQFGLYPVNCNWPAWDGSVINGKHFTWSYIFARCLICPDDLMLIMSDGAHCTQKLLLQPPDSTESTLSTCCTGREPTAMFLLYNYM